MKSSKHVQRVLQFFAKAIKKRQGEFSILVLCRVISAMIPMIIPRYYGQLIQGLTNAGTPSPEVLTLTWHMLLMIALRYGVEFVVRRILEYIIVKMETASMKDLYTLCFDYLHRHSFKFFANNFVGALVKKINKLVGGYETIVDIFIFEIVQLVVMITILIVVMRHQHRVLGLLFFAWIICYSIFQYVLYKKVLPHDMASQEQDSVVTGVLADTITNNSNITTFSSLGHENRRFGETAEKWRYLTQKARYKKNIIYATNSILMISVEIVIMVIIIRLRAKGVIGVGLIVTLQIYLLQLFDRIFFIGKTFKRLFTSISESAEMIAILDTPHEIQDAVNAKALSVSKGKIVFDKVSFQYNQKRLFNDLEITVSPGEKIGLVGPSGSGKSTIIKLLFRIYDIQHGQITIDGQDIAKVTQESLRDSISLVPQDPMLFHRSLRENIAYGKPDASMKDILKASQMARCHEFIQSLPEGYETLVGERGIKLSGGERQRVAIARAILENKKILVMDEATSSLDSESEKLIQEAIHEVIKNKTAIIIAHRLSTIKEMDRIIVMQDGKVVEQGDHQSLLKQDKGLYQKLRQIQSS